MVQSQSTLTGRAV